MRRPDLSERTRAQDEQDAHRPAPQIRPARVCATAGLSNPSRRLARRLERRASCNRDRDRRAAAGL